VENQWSLFGLDLSQLTRGLKLAIHQIIWGEESGLRRKFYPAARIINANEPIMEPYSNLIVDAGQRDSPEPLAMLFPDEFALLRTVQLPLEAEIDLGEAMYFEISSHSPFPSEDTCSGWRVTSRDADSLYIAFAIASRSTVRAYINEHAGSEITPSDELEIWTGSRDCLVQLDGFGGRARRNLYYRRLLNRGRALLLLLSAVCMLIAFPAAILAARSQQLQDVLVSIEAEARNASSLRVSTVALEGQVLAARDFFTDRAVYDFWLNAIAEVTPDSVYLTRLGLEGDRLTISGMAVNAAAYQTTLASSGLVTDLSAPSAFTRDARTGRERFTLTMRLATKK
jgi:general secretion pathway protein L